ncbi:MAG: hypothetical protein IBX45_12860 [Campylobacterales bacterium]|nr:hypothetical protein [Campylobacterales bacterium]
MENPSKTELAQEIARLIESDPQATPMAYDVLMVMEEADLVTIRDNLERTKRTRNNEAWYDELVQKCGKECS